MYTTQNDLSASIRKSMVELLQPSLTSAIDLMLQAKQAHWNVKGPQFAALHAFFDDINTQTAAQVDLIAERLVMLGGIAIGTIQKVNEATKLPKYPVDIKSGPDHIKNLAQSMSFYAKQLRASIQVAADAGDADTSDLFTGISREVDKTLWMLEAHLES